MKADEIQKEINLLNAELGDIYKSYKSVETKRNELVSKRKLVLFEEACEYIAVGEVITLKDKPSFNYSRRCRKLRQGDVIEVLRKNKKSLTVRYVSSDRKSYVDKIDRVDFNKAGMWIVAQTGFRSMVNRDQKLKSLLV